MFFYKSPDSGENLLPKPDHLCSSAFYLVLCCYWSYCQAKLLLCSHYNHYASRMTDSQMSSAKSLLAPFNIESCSNIFTWCTGLNLSWCSELLPFPQPWQYLSANQNPSQDSSRVPNEVIHICAECFSTWCHCTKATALWDNTDKEEKKKCTLV